MGNGSVLDDIDIDFVDNNSAQNSIWLLIIGALSFVVWGVFAAFYFSRLSAIFVTFAIDKYLRLSKNGIYLRIGSISITGLHAGKIMFRNVVYDNGDVTIKINDGHFLFKYWLPVEQRHLNLEKKRATRLHLILNGLHVNIYNSLSRYSEIAKIRRFTWFFEECHLADVKRQLPPDRSPPSSVWKNVWNLIGMVQIEVSSGCVLIGNQVLPYAVWTRFENFSTKTSVSDSENDRALLKCEGDVENFSISLIKNEEYKFTEKDKEPPRSTGNDGFMLLQTASMTFCYKQDLCGYVTDEDSQQINSKIPIWSSEYRFGNNTVFSYGPWAEQQKGLIYSFFFPPDYQTAPVTVMPKRGEKRILIKHRASIILTKESCLDIWFMRGDQLESIRTRFGAESSINMSVLWITTTTGFQWDLKGKLLNMETTTSLLFTKLIECEKFSFNGSFKYPLTWNGEQIWQINYNFSKATAWFVWDHKRLFSDLINDWVGDEPPDITKYVPFRVFNRLEVVDSFEVIMLLNQCNWIDTSDKKTENVECAIVGEYLSFDFELAFVEFLPQIQCTKYHLKGERDIALRLRYPPDSATSPIVAALMSLSNSSSNAPKSTRGSYSLNSDEWLEVWRTELIVMNFDHQYRPVVLRQNIQTKLPYSVLLDYLPKAETHPWKLEPDYLSVDILIDGSEVKLIPVLIRAIFDLKNNYFGYYDSMTSIDSEIPTKNTTTKDTKSAFERVPPNSPAELYRFMDCDVNIRVCNVRAEIPVYSPFETTDISKDDSESCPVLLTEEIVIEVKKKKSEALIQVGLGPTCAYFDKSNIQSKAGYLTLSGAQFRGHAMYSAKDVVWNMGVVEYGWIMEILVGDIGGTLDFPSHAYVVHQLLELFMVLLLSPDDNAIVPERMQFCQHGELIKSCSIARKLNNDVKSVCQSEENLKYDQIRVAVDSINLTFGEEKTLMQLESNTIRFTLCNAHESKFNDHICLRLPVISIRQAIRTSDARECVWLEGSSLRIDGVSLDFDLPVSPSVTWDPKNTKMDFMKKHDEESKRLHFLWAQQSFWGCACFGNTHFFAKDDRIGKIFLEMSHTKLFEPGIEKDPTLQPMVHQSVLVPKSSMFKKSSQMFYKQKRTGSANIVYRSRGSMETDSYHSAESVNNQKFSRILNSSAVLDVYENYVNNLKVIMPETIEIPAFGEPNAVANWCEAHKPTTFVIDDNKLGVNSIRLNPAKNDAPKNRKSMTPDNAEPTWETQEYDGQYTSGNPATRARRRLAIDGVAATSVEVFVSPIGLEGIERFINAVSRSVENINPCLLIHMCYRDCALRKHRQPLTDSLFTEEDDDEHIRKPDLEIMLDLPRISIGMFQCGLKRNLSNSAVFSSTDAVSANIALILVDRAWINSKSVQQSGGGGGGYGQKNGTPSDARSVVYQLQCDMVTGQLLQITNKEKLDFAHMQGNMISIWNNWDECPISQRLSQQEPRMMMDFSVCAVSVFVERRPVILQKSTKSYVRTSHEPGKGTSPKSPKSTNSKILAVSDKAKGKSKQVLTHEHYIKASIGSVSTSVVMARPQELTAGDEFPIYEALAPILISWHGVFHYFSDSLANMFDNLSYWKAVATAKILKMALDCTDERVAVKCGKNRMQAIRVLGKHQGSCASCILLKTLFRWFAFSKEACGSSCRNEIRAEFESEDTRKTALLALLSHWQPYIGKELNLVSSDDAFRFKVMTSTDPDLGKMNATEKNETVVPMEITAREMDGRRKSFLTRISSAPIFNKLRRRGGTDDEVDIEMQLLNNSDEMARGQRRRQNENVDLYTWMRNAQRESRRSAGKVRWPSSELVSGREPEFINPMDVQQKAFFYTIYRWARLQWTTLDDVENDHICVDYSLVLKEVDVRMMAKSVKVSTDQKRQYITPAQQKVMQIRNAAVSGSLIWNLERDEKRKVPMAAEWNISYNGNIEGIRFLIGMATVSLGKELYLVFRAAIEMNNELQRMKMESSRKKTKKEAPTKEQKSWDDKVLDMAQDYDKNVKRMMSNQNGGKNQDKVLVYMNGTASISSVVLESVLNDLYVSAMILKIDVVQDKKPLLLDAIDDAKTTKKGSKDSKSGPKFDEITISLAKMSLTLSESDSSNKKADILRCSLNSSQLDFYTKPPPPTNVKDVSTAAHAQTNLGGALCTHAKLKFGALEGSMPMAAHSLHDVVMRHGKELEQQFNRLAAQPATPMAEPDSASGNVPEPTIIPTSVNLLQVSKPTASSLPENMTNITRRRVPIAVINFIVELTSIEMNIQLLPSLHAKYRIHRASSSGVTGDKAKWDISIDDHFFEFCVTTKVTGDTFRLQLPSIKCSGHYSVEKDSFCQKPSTEKTLVYREGGSLHMTVILGNVNHMFTTELLNQLMFAEHSFRSELIALINRIRSSSSKTSGASAVVLQNGEKKDCNLSLNLNRIEKMRVPESEKPPLLFTIKVMTKITQQKSATPWLQLTASTPSQTAARLTIDSLEGELTNKWVVKQEGSKERIYGSAVIHFNAKLGQLLKPVTSDEVCAELQEYATFMTQVRVENKDRNVLNSEYSYHVTLNRPILLVKAAAIDKAILLWLNYKQAYDYWKNEMEKVKETVVVKHQKQATTNQGMFSPSQITEDVDMNLSLAINNGMYMCMPLYSYDMSDGMPALVLSLRKSELSVLVKGELTCRASFTGFKLSFVDDFDEKALTQSFLDVAHSEQSNCFYFPEGTYQLCSKATSTTEGPAKWVLSVSAEMQGIEIDLDQRIGKLAKLLANTCSMIGKGEEEDMWDGGTNSIYVDAEVEGMDEFKKLKDEEKVPWLENKMHQHSRAVFELASRGVPSKKLETEKKKLRQFELIRFKAFRRNMVEKLRRSSASSTSIKSDFTMDLPKSPMNKSSEDIPSLNSREPDVVNFNVDVKINITSGTCTLRTSKKDCESHVSFTGQLGETMKRLNQGTRDIKAMFESQTLRETTFSIPSVEIKAYHVSDPSESTHHERFSTYLEKHQKIPKHFADDAEEIRKTLDGKSRFTNDNEFIAKPSTRSVKKNRGCFYMFVGLASMPHETVVTPHLATYVEQVLEPLPPSSFKSTSADGEKELSPVANQNEVHNIVAMDTAALPIDFVLYLDVQSSTIRFDGKQESSRSQAAADCLLTLPRLTLEMTTKRSTTTTMETSNYVGGMHISGQFKGFMLKIYNPLEPELDVSRALQLSLDTFSFVISRNKNSSTEADNRVRFVFSSQIGRASFEYNFRRLGELIQFPKPWYRATIARRVFFGDQSSHPRRPPSQATNSTAPSAAPEAKKNGEERPPAKPWVAMVLAAVQWNEFEVTAFMSNTMGKTRLTVSKGLVWGDAKLNSSHERDVKVNFVLASSEICARDGAISGDIKLNKLHVSAAHSMAADLKKTPVNKMKVNLEWITANIEWMSRRVIIAKWTKPSVKIFDYYNGVREGTRVALSSFGMNVKASWNEIQVVITKSTIEDTIAIVKRLISFFEEQLKNSKIFLGNFSQNLGAAKKEKPVEARKPMTHLWEKVLDYVSVMQMNDQLLPLMERQGARVGGVVELKAGGISLVLMKGDMNSDTWAVFRLRDAHIQFEPSAAMDFLDAQTKQKIGILLKQEFRIQLGSKLDNNVENLANVCRVQTRFNSSRHLLTTDEILDYFIGDVMKILGRNHNIQKSEKEQEGKDGATGMKSAPSFSGLRSTYPKDSLPKANETKNGHNVMELFQFPGLEAKMTSEQLNGVDDGDNYQSAFTMPMEVVTTFVSDFFSEVAIETNFNAQVSFLPELLKSYLKESSTTSSQITSTSSSGSTPSALSPAQPTQGSNEEMQKDPRIFVCREWLVEPRVRFIDRIKWTPPVLDDILKKLQIFDHRSTIPKVLQRAVLDTLDTCLASATIATLNMIDTKKTIQQFDKEKKSNAD